MICVSAPAGPDSSLYHSSFLKSPSSGSPPPSCVHAPDLQFHLNEEVLLFFNQAAVMSRGTARRVDRTTDLRSVFLSFAFPLSQFLSSTLCLHIFYQVNLPYFSVIVPVSSLFALLLSLFLAFQWLLDRQGFSFIDWTPLLGCAPHNSTERINKLQGIHKLWCMRCNLFELVLNINWLSRLNVPDL